ncbi:hypothetical protein TSOC_009230 [Tetrabaena socialis]|uniref:Uncharacterized protein n=1 Tax=Tetrabaena socialis TaxID=47790 RepID=A0A2J7ZWD3_9CHLO|nr:hypothetical protein TSOC_009230 [Tetrabaena socialis]|eukprot:PNH04579.1 hypothetical protein TSOC_009230 [Tetrabaena socialis]
MMLHAANPRSALPARAVRRNALQPRAPRALVTRVRAEEKSGLAKVADSFGMPSDDGFFGFTPFSEMWVGRWSMLGFVSSIVVEFVTGKGTLAQVGLPAPSMPLLVAMVAVFGGATVVGSVVTVQQLVTKKMSRTSIDRYRSFLGLTKEDDWMSDTTARRMKGKADFTTPGVDTAAIEEVRREGMPADRFLSVDGTAAAQSTAEDMKAGVAVAEEPVAEPTPSSRPQISQSQLYSLDEAQYARDVEIANGRAAMVGFLAAILVEAATGKGIILQIIAYLKWSGILGPMSGF